MSNETERSGKAVQRAADGDRAQRIYDAMDDYVDELLAGRPTAHMRERIRATVRAALAETQRSSHADESDERKQS